METSSTDKREDVPCELCGGMGFVMPNVPPEDSRFGRAIPCSCKYQELSDRKTDNLIRMSQLGQLRTQTFESFMKEGVGLSSDLAQNLRWAYKIAQQYAQKPEGWLVLKGGYGCGKTHLAASIANAQLEVNRSVLFVNAPDLLDHLRATFRPGSEISYDDLFEKVRTTPLLIIDDFGAHSPSAWAQEKLYQIFNYRYNAQLPTVVTTNEEIEELEPRIRSRLCDLSFVQTLSILAPDFRRGQSADDFELSSLHMHDDKSLDNFTLRNNELSNRYSQNLHRALQMMHDYTNDPSGWIVLHSNEYGCGKTHLAAAAANSFIKQGKSVLFVMVPDLLDHLRATFDPKLNVRLDKRFSQIKNAPILILDDLGTENASPWAKEKLHQLFNYRYTANLPTIITTAVPFDQLDPKLIARFLDRRRCTLFQIEAPPYRGDVKKKR